MSNFSSIYKGSVYDVNDPLQSGRVRALVPQVLGTSPSGWATPTLPVSGIRNVNTVEDRVWVFFEGGDINRPTYISRSTVRALDLAPDVPLGRVRPVGEVTMFMGLVIPEGWLALNGQTFFNAVFPALALLFGNSSPTGTTTLPDARESFPVGRGASGAFSGALGSKGGSLAKQITNAHLPAHGHTVSDSGHVHGQVVTNGGTPSPGSNNSRNDFDSDTFNAVVYSQGVNTDASLTGVSINPTTAGNQNLDVTPPFIIMNYMIRAIEHVTNQVPVP